ncbi:Saccharopine dehydrogenase NADP binding domain [Rhizoctonia solani]|uniref:Saccharopine dehydrogenase NADP binding domain n=1 Tax=Rhizoctonia solani TaxID=456999 RepID=A0A8H7I848_9AGAM|nr:Saccharopine dehydrogenase NADP binding domain [Rhizoctonia solani]
MVERQFDILVIGATGYTGRLIIEYLANHSRASSLRIALGGRTISKVQELARKYQNIDAVYLDVSKERTVEEAIAKTRVVINIAGPYWTRGSVVVRACARNGVHYLDLTGEAPWVAKIIEEYDYLAHKNRACIVPCSGYDSIPSDIAAYLSVQTLERQLSGKSTYLSYSSNSILSVSGGTAATLFSFFEEVPREYRLKGVGWGLSPVSAPWVPACTKNPLLPPLCETHHLGRVLFHEQHQRTYRPPLMGPKTLHTPTLSRPTFSYTEFHNTGSSRIKGALLSLGIMSVMAGLASFPPFRWFLKWMMPKSGQGPKGGGVVVKSWAHGDGDPGYRLTSIMIVESALLLLDPDNLTRLEEREGSDA